MSGEEFTQILIQRGWTQAAFAEHVGRTRRQVVRWCQAPSAIPGYVEAIAQTLPRRVVTVTKTVRLQQAG